MLAPPSGAPQEEAASPTTWPKRAKVIVVVLLITTIIGAVGVIAAFALLADRSDEVDQLEAQVASLVEQRGDARATVDQLENDLGTLEADVAASASQVTELESTVAELQPEVATLTSERDDARSTIDQLQNDLMQRVVSNGDGIQVAVPYPSGASIQPIAVLGSGAQGPVAEQLPASWEPPSVFELELVADVGESTQTVIEECPYNGPNITRYRYSTTIAVYAATTGERIAEETLNGADPRQCQQSEPYSLTELHGDEVSPDEIIGWLEQFVVPNG